MSDFHDAKNTYWDPRFKRHTVKLLPGEYHTTTGKEILVTVLGSCIAACIRDTRSGIGGMNHFLLPEQKKKPETSNWAENYESSETRYGDLAMEMLINDIIKRGGNRSFFEAKIFGGAQMFESNMKVGERNIEFVSNYLKVESIPVVSNDVAGSHGRKIYYIPETGDIFLKRIISIHNNTIEKREKAYLKKAKQSRTEAEIDFF
ncbi:MAG: chemoreceptor glutamine deamidase CheD [Pseudomonadota bacterium]